MHPSRTFQLKGASKPQPPVSLPLIPSSPRSRVSQSATQCDSKDQSEKGMSAKKEVAARPVAVSPTKTNAVEVPQTAMTQQAPKSVAARLAATSARTPSRVIQLSPRQLDTREERGEADTSCPTEALDSAVATETSPRKRASVGDDAALESEFAALMPPDDLTAATLHTRKAFRQLAAKYKAALAAKDEEIRALKEESTQPGGQKYILMQDELDWTRKEMGVLQSKINSLVKLLDRAGATIRQAEEKKSPSSATASTAYFSSGGLNAVDWSPLKGTMRDLLLQGKNDKQIVEAIARYISKLTAQVASLESASEGNRGRVSDMEHRREALMRTIQQQQKEIDDLRDELYRSKRLGVGDYSSSTTDGSPSSEIGALRKEFEAERARLLHQVTSLETAMRSTIDARPYFVALGKGPSVPPFLRHDGKVRNIALSKPVVENIIIAVWLTRFGPTLDHCAALSEAGITAEVRSKGAKAVLEALSETSVLSKALERMFAAEGLLSQPRPRGSNPMADINALEGGSGNTRMSIGLPPASEDEGGHRLSVVSASSPSARGDPTGRTFGLVDYDNLSLWSIPRADVRKLLSFQDHLARFFLELCRPDKLPVLFASYTSERGVTTPPVAEVARNARARLLLCVPQQASLMRPGAAMPAEVAEVAYSLMDGCDKFSFDADVELFRRIVKGQLPEAAFVDQTIMVQKLKVALLQSAVVEREEVNAAAGIVTQSFRRVSTISWGEGSSVGRSDDWDEGQRVQPTVGSILRMLRKFFPAKSPDDFKLLQRALLLDVGAISLNNEGTGLTAARGDGSGPIGIAVPSSGGLEGMGAVAPAHMALAVDVRQLFASNASGNQGYFIEAVRNQHVESISTYMAEVQCAILSLAQIESPPPPHSQQRDRRESLALTGGKGSQQRSGAAKGRRASRGGGALQQQHAPIIVIRDKVASVDPMKPREDVNAYVYHLLQLLHTEKMRAGSPDSDLLHKACEDWFEPPLCYHTVNVDELTRYCPLVLCKRCGVAGAVGANGGAGTAQQVK